MRAQLKEESFTSHLRVIIIIAISNNDRFL